MPDSNPVIRSAVGCRPAAVLGGLLITLVLAVLLASRLGDDASFQDVVVARRDLPPGTVLEADDLAIVRILDEVDFVIDDTNDGARSCSARSPASSSCSAPTSLRRRATCPQASWSCRSRSSPAGTACRTRRARLRARHL